MCVEARVRRNGCRAGQTGVPWAVAGACTWTGVEDPDTMLKELEPGDRAPGISDRLADLQWHTQAAVCFRSPPSKCRLAITPTLVVSPPAPGALVVKCVWVGAARMWLYVQVWSGLGKFRAAQWRCGRRAYRCPVRSPDNSLAPATVCATATAKGIFRDMTKGLCHFTSNINFLDESIN